MPLEIEKSGKPKYGDEAWEVTFKIPSPPEAIKALHFLDADGQEIESKKTGSSSFGMPGKMTYKRTYDLTEKPAQARIEVEVYTDLE